MKGILFRPEFFPAIDAGRKTQTRRVIKPQPPTWCEDFGFSAFTPSGSISGRGNSPEGYGEKFFRMRYKPGETVFIKEGWACSIAYDSYGKVSHHVGEVAYRSGGGFDFEGGAERGKWRNAMFMPEWAARRFIQIDAVSVERVQDIDNIDAKAEGFVDSAILDEGCSVARDVFIRRWNDINGPESWDANPFVFVYSFHTVTKAEAMKGTT